MNYGNLKVPENVTPEVQVILDSYEARNKEIGKNHLKNMGRIGLGSVLSGASAHPVFNIPYIGTGLGGALYELGQGITGGDKLPELAKRTRTGFAIGETVGTIPYAGKYANKLSGGKIGNALTAGVEKLASTPLGQKVTEIAPKVEDVLMTDIKAFNPFKQTQTAYHGSPYDFNKFSNEAIGTGEGAQAHGYGHYAAKNKDIGERYRQILSPITYNEKIQSRLWSDLKNDRIPQLKNNEEKELFEFISGNLHPSEFNTRRLKHYFDDLETPQAKEYADILLNELENNNNQGQLYKLSIPKDDVMLREDLPLSQQPIKVQENFKKLYSDYFINPDADYSLQKIMEKDYKGKDLYNILVHQEINKQYPFGSKEYRINRINPEFEKNASNLLNQHGIKGISYNGGIDGEANVIFNPDDIEIVRKYYNQPELWDKLKGLRPNEGAELAAIENALRNPQFPMNEQDFNAYEDLGLRYYQNIFQPNTIEIPGYGVASFSRKNRGKDDVTNFRMYPDLFELLTGAKPVNRTNYKNELDRQYDYLENPNNKIYQFLMEDIKDKGKRYKMMRNKETGK